MGLLFISPEAYAAPPPPRWPPEAERSFLQAQKNFRQSAFAPLPSQAVVVERKTWRRFRRGVYVVLIAVAVGFVIAYLESGQ